MRVAVGLLAVAACTESTPGLAPDRDAEGSAPPDRGGVITDLDNVGTSLHALGSVWAVTSNLSDEYSPGDVEAAVVRVDPATGEVRRVIDSPGLEPRLAAAGGRVWAKLDDRLVALDPDGVEVGEISVDLSRSDDLVSAGNLIWLVVTNRNEIVMIDPETVDIVGTVPTGAFPVAPVAAFGFVWVLNLVDGTITTVDVESGAEGEPVTMFVTENPKFAIPVPGAAIGDEIWVTNIDGEIHALPASPGGADSPRRIEVDEAINSVVVHGDRAFLLPTWGTSVLVLDLGAEVVVREIPIDSIPVRALVAHGLVWVTGDGERETLTAIDPESLDVVGQVGVGTNSSTTTGPLQPFEVGEEIWVPNRGDDAFFIVHPDDL